MPFRALLTLFFAAAHLLASPAALGQDAPPIPVPSEIQREIERLGPEGSLSPAQAQARELLLQAKASAEAAEASRAKISQWRDLADAAPALMEEIRAELARPLEATTVRGAPGATLADLERELAQADIELQAARAELDQIQLEQPRRDERLREIADRAAALTTEIELLREQLGAGPAPDAEAVVAGATRLALEASLAAKRSQLAELDAERVSYEARRDLLPLRRDRAVRRAAAAEQRFNAWQTIVNHRRQSEAERIAGEAMKVDLARAREIPELRPIAAQVESLRSLLVGDARRRDTGRLSAPERLTGAAKDLSEKTSKLREIEELGRDVHERVSTGRLSSAQGQYLRNALATLPEAIPLERQLRRYARESGEAHWQLLELRDLEAESSDVERALATLRAELGADAPPQTLELASKLLEQRRTLVREALGTYSEYSGTLDELMRIYERLITASGSLRDLIEERVFWVRSTSGPIIPRPDTVAREMRWLLDPAAWAGAASNATGRVVPGAELLGRAARLATAPVLALLLLVLAYAARWRLRQRAAAPLPREGRLGQNSIGGTIVKLTFAMAAAFPLPVALWMLGAWLGASAEIRSAPAAVSTGLARAAYILLALNLLRELAQPGAVGAAHFRWSEAGLAHLRRHLRWFVPFAAITAAAIQTFEYRRAEVGADALGRSAFAGALLVIAAFYSVVFSPRRPLVGEYIKKHRGGLIERAAWAWFPLLVALPVSLSIAALAGYVYTALQIQRETGDTAFFVVLTIVGYALVLRWMQLARRTLAIEAAKARAAAAEKAERVGGDQQGEGERDTPRELEPAPEIDITSISLQSRKIVQVAFTVVLIVGLYIVWADVLPALRWFERVQIFPTIAYVDPEAGAGVPAPGPAVTEQPAAEPPGAQGGAQAQPSPPDSPTQLFGADTQTSEPALVRVSLADLGLAVLLLVLAVSASKNVPGLLEITVLPRLPLDAAGRYAAYTVARYVIIVLGIVAVSSVLSISWKSAQWLAAALTFGLAFGLQEIFANFVSGLIILFEQPIRVGDTVTVGDVSGTVSRVRMRATTIIDWDNKELVIPNKMFITDPVVNWTLSDPVTRIIVPVGIAYGSDTERARDLLLKVARECQYVLDKPEPKAQFLGFGDSSLSLDLRAYVGDVNSALAARSDLHFRIDRAFREAGIEIAFPQQDLHIRSIDQRVLDDLRAQRPDTRPE